MKTKQLKSLAPHAEAPRQKARGSFDFPQRRLAMVIPLLFAVEAGPAFAANCALNGATLTTSVTNSVACSNYGTLTINSPGSLTNASTGILLNRGTIVNNNFLTNNGLLRNTGTITSAGVFVGQGILNNSGSLVVLAGGKTAISSATNLSNGTLTGGTWFVDSFSKTQIDATAFLSVGKGDITTNNANIALNGAGARFDQINKLQNNQGSLTAAGGASLNLTSVAFNNTGTVTTLGGSINIAGSSNLTGKTLTGGTWIVDGGALAIGTNKIDINNATIVLSGGASKFDQINNLQTNQGSLTIASREFILTGEVLNTGTLIADSASITLGGSKNLSNGTLTGGTWVVAGNSTLTVGAKDITTNNANILLSGSGAQFSQINNLQNNQGSLTLENGASFTNLSGLTNTGTLTTKAGGTFFNSKSLTNNGLISNNGFIRTDGFLGGGGTFNNNGTLVVRSGGGASIAHSVNLSKGTLSGGTWVVDSSAGTTAKLAIGVGNITTNRANIELIGANASFDQIAGLQNNQGSLTIGAGLTTSFTGLNNTGTLTVASGGTLNLINSANFSNGTLSGGTWIADDSNAKVNTNGAHLNLGAGQAIVTNNANIVLIGDKATFQNLGNTLQNNLGSLTLGRAANFSSTSLQNMGSITASGGNIKIASSKNFSSGTLTGGTWVVADGGALAIGSGNITTNQANIELSGATSSFAQLAGLNENQGTFKVSNGASFGAMTSFFNTGTVIASAASINFDKSKNLINGTLTGGNWLVEGGGSLTLASGGISTNNANVVVSGANSSFAQLNSLQRNQGSLTLDSGATLTTIASIENTGTFTTSNGGTLQLGADKAGFKNSNIVFAAGNILGHKDNKGLANSQFLNSGNLTITDTGSVSGFADFTQFSGITTLSGGLLSANSVHFAGGTLKGYGTIDPPAPIVIDAGVTVNPTGELVFEGDTLFNGKLQIDIADLNDFGTLTVLGALNFGLGSEVDFNFDSGLILTDTTHTFQFLNVSNGIGGFENVTFNFFGLDDPTQLALNCNSLGCSLTNAINNNVPEPGTLPLAMLGMLGLAYTVWRRKRLQLRTH